MMERMICLNNEKLSIMLNIRYREFNIKIKKEWKKQKTYKFVYGMFDSMNTNVTPISRLLAS